MSPKRTKKSSISSGQKKIRVLQHALADDLKAKNYIRSAAVETAFRVIPRHLFVPGVPLEDVYSHRALPVKQTEDGQWLSSSSSPATMAMMLEQLDLQPGQKVLEIGAGTGYNAALIAHIVGESGRVITVDIDAEMVTNARARLADAGITNVDVICADGGYGYAAAAPYDRIVFTVGAADILPMWREQLHPNGRLVLPLSITWSERSIAFQPTNGYLTSRSSYNCSFMRLRGDFPGISWDQLGPEAGLLLGSSREHQADPEQVYRLLTGPFKDWDTGLTVTLTEVIFGLELWVSLNKPEVRHVLAAQNGMAARNIVPPLVIGEDPKAITTGVLIGEQSMVALMRPPERTASFPLLIRQFGTDETLARHLLRQIAAWDAAGRPGTKGLRIRAFPKGHFYIPQPGDFLVEKSWNTFVLDWPAAQ